MSLTSLLEITFSTSHTVDRDAGVIRGVRVLGRVSRNDREYSDRALGEAARLYEGIGVNLNHADRRQGNADRPVEAGFGWLAAPQVRDDGVYADLHFFKSHPQADVIAEAAERNPRRFGLSHTAEGQVTRRGDKNVVESIETVRSVDIVQNPATNAGLFESQEPTMHKSVRQIVTEVHAGRYLPFLSATPAALADAPIELLSEAAADDQAAAALKSVLAGVLDDGTLDLAGKLARIQDLVAAPDQPAPAAGGVSAPPVAESAPASSAADPLLGQLAERLERLETEHACRLLLEAHGRACDATRLKALAGLTNPDERERLIESWPERAGAFPSGRSPRPAISPPLNESESVLLPRDAKALAAALR